MLPLKRYDATVALLIGSVALPAEAQRGSRPDYCVDTPRIYTRQGHISPGSYRLARRSVVLDPDGNRIGYLQAGDVAQVGSYLMECPIAQPDALSFAEYQTFVSTNRGYVLLPAFF